MPNKTRKCTSCKQYFLRDMKGWGKYPVGWIHSYECRQKLIERTRIRLKRKQEIATKKAVDKKRAEFYANDLGTRKKVAAKACHAYIRERDKNDPCICCGRPFGENSKRNAGHFLESANNPRLRFHEDNINLQLEYCNTYQGGNSDDYEGRLRLKIGNDRVDWLLANKGGTVKRTPQDYKKIEEYYKAKLKEISNEHTSQNKEF